MLDTNICSFIIRNKPKSIKEKLKKVEENNIIALSSIVVSELIYGATKKESPKLMKIVTSFIDNFIVYDYSKVSAQFYGNIRTDLEKKGKIIGANDLLIASHALTLGATLVTNNTREFKRIEGLILEDWTL
jgi:tRNA(fMet)-specific endonuclease VapC